MTPEYPRTGPGGIFQWDARRSGMVSDWVAMFFRSESLSISSLCKKTMLKPGIVSSGSISAIWS